MAEKNRIGTKVTQLRESRKLTRQELAERTEFPEEMIGRIESGEWIPSLSPLVKIARVLGVRLGTFLDDQENIGPIVTREDHRRATLRFSGRSRGKRPELDFFALAADKTGRHMEPFLIDVHALPAKEIVLSAHEGEEFIYVLAGEVEISYGKETYLLRERDSIYYDSIVSHNVRCHGDRDARILAVVYAPY